MPNVTVRRLEYREGQNGASQSLRCLSEAVNSSLKRFKICSGKKISATKKLRPFLEPNPNQTFLKVITCSEVSFHYFSLIQSSALPELS